LDDKKRTILIAVAGVILLIALFLIVRSVMGGSAGPNIEGVEQDDLRLN